MTAATIPSFRRATSRGVVEDRSWPASRGDLGVVALVIAWIGSILALDSISDLTEQRLLGVATWSVLIALLARERGRVRAQVAIVVAFASVIEYTFSGALHVYVYRLHDVPWFVPPGHGLVYLAALCFGRCPAVRRWRGLLVPATFVVGGGYALYGLLAPRTDVLGAFWFGCLAVFLWRGRSPTVFVGAFIIVTYLELLGTGIGAWTWHAHDFTGLVAIGNPPSGAAGGYGFFDAAALAGAPWLERRLERLWSGLSRVTGVR